MFYYIGYLTLNKHDESFIYVFCQLLKIYAPVTGWKLGRAPWLSWLHIRNRLASGQNCQNWLNSEMKSVQSKLLIKLQSSLGGQPFPPLSPAEACGWWATYLGRPPSLLPLFPSFHWLIAPFGLSEDGPWLRQRKSSVRSGSLCSSLPTLMVGSMAQLSQRNLVTDPLPLPNSQSFCPSDPREEE